MPKRFGETWLPKPLACNTYMRNDKCPFAAVVIGSGSGWPGGNGNVGVAGPEKHVPQNVRYELAIHIFFFEPLFILIALLNVTILLDSTFPLDFKIDKLGSIDF